MQAYYTPTNDVLVSLYLDIAVQKEAQGNEREAERFLGLALQIDAWEEDYVL
jgi:hypothetical protein